MSSIKNTSFLADPIGFMRKYAVCPADDVGGYIGDKAGSMPTTASPQDYTFSTIEAAKRVAYLNFEKIPRKSQVNTAFIPKSDAAITVTGQSAADAARVKSYWLPWTAGGGIIKLVIPAAGTAPAAQDADIFFTATITGCSIFIKGTRQAPEVYHAGGNTGQANATQAALFWRNLMVAHSGAGGIAAEVNKTDYVSDPTLSTALPTTANSKTFADWLADNKPSDLDIKMVFPWGCVMGLRAANGDWTFYLQENVTILYTKWKKKSLFSKQLVESRSFSVACPMLVREIYPNGGMHHVFLPHLPKKM
jgi:hypothetical protein